MYTDVFWCETPVTGVVGIMPRPRGGDWLEGEIKNFTEQGVNVIVSLLTLDEVIELQLSDEQGLCHQHGIEFFSVPVDDRCIPETIREIQTVVTILNQRIADGKKVVIHCRQGIGRSGLLAASVLTSFGVSANEAFRRIELSRGRSVPDTQEQREWVETFAEFNKIF